MHHQSFAGKQLAPLLMSVGFLTTSHMLLGCAMAHSANQRMTVAQEQAVIVWDQTTHTEHFIRRAEFMGNAKDFGFLVPTPHPPTLHVADGQVFQDLADMGEPEHKVKLLEGPVFTTVLFGYPNDLTHTGRMATSSVSEAPVSVLSAQRVGPYDATVLRAGNTAALEGWLHRHGYETRPALMQWLAPYLQRGWAITAFKIANPDQRRGAVLPSVRMSFHTDKPFYPYREPSDSGGQNGSGSMRSLSVFLISDARMAGALESGPAPWRGKTLFAKPLTATVTPTITRMLDLTESDTTHMRWLTAMTDDSHSRDGDGDLYFQPSQSQDPVVIPPYITIDDHRFPVFVDMVALLLAAVMGYRWLRRYDASKVKTSYDP